MTLEESLESYFSNAAEPVLFVGAGVSARAGLPAWKQLFEHLAKFIDPHHKVYADLIRQEADKNNFLQAASLYFMAKSDTLLEKEKLEYLREILKEYEYKKLKCLIELPFTRYITTNYDRALLDAYHEYRSTPSLIDITYQGKGLEGAAYETAPHLVRVHGAAELPKSIILSTEHYTSINQDIYYNEFLAHHFANSDILFIGFSFYDPAIKSVFETVKIRFSGQSKGSHLALIPDGCDENLVRKLNEFNIKTQRYNPENNHEDLWRRVCNVRAAIKDQSKNTSRVAHGITAKNEHQEKIKRLVASCYAREKVSLESKPLKDSVIDGIVYSLITKERQSKEQMSVSLEKELLLTKFEAATICNDSLSRLIKTRQVEENEDKTYQANGEGDDNGNTFQSAISSLVNSSIDRYVVREAGKDNEQIRDLMDRYIKQVVIERAWEGGNSLLSPYSNERTNLEEIFFEIERKFTVREISKRAIMRSVLDVFENPSPSDARTISGISKIVFAIDVTLKSPLSTLLRRVEFPEKIYLDANIIMPIIFSAHPLSEIYRESLSQILEHQKKRGLKTEILTTNGFIEEILSHKDVALREANELGNYFPISVKTAVSIYKSQNINIFSSVYYLSGSLDSNIEFEEFIKNSFPYRKKDELSRFLEDNFGIKSINEDHVMRDAVFFDSVNTGLQKYYADSLERNKKKPVVISHDAKLLTLIKKDIEEGHSPLFVTADKSLRRAVSQSSFRDLSETLISNHGLVQLIELSIGPLKNSKGLSELFWDMPIRSESDQIRNHLINLALSIQDAALNLEMGELLDKYVASVQGDLKRSGIRLSSDNESHQRAAIRILGQYGENFYKDMREVQEGIHRDAE